MAHLFENPLIPKALLLSWIIVSISFPLIIILQTIISWHKNNRFDWIFFSFLVISAFFQPLIIGENGDRIAHNNMGWTSYSTYAFIAPISIAMALNQYRDKGFLCKIPLIFYLSAFLSTIPWYGLHVFK